MTFTSADWDTDQDLVITPTDDDDNIDHLDGFITVEVTSTAAGWMSVPDKTIYVRVIDDENFGYNIILPGAEIFTSFEDQESVVLKVPEGDTRTFSFSLTGPPTHDVTVAVGEASDKFDVSPKPQRSPLITGAASRPSQSRPSMTPTRLTNLERLHSPAPQPIVGTTITPTRLLCSLMMTNSSSTSQVIASTWMKEAPPQLT